MMIVSKVEKKYIQSKVCESNVSLKVEISKFTGRCMKIDFEKLDYLFSNHVRDKINLGYLCDVFKELNMEKKSSILISNEKIDC